MKILLLVGCIDLVSFALMPGQQVLELREDFQVAVEQRSHRVKFGYVSLSQRQRLHSFGVIV